MLRNSGEFRYEAVPVLPSRLTGYLRSLRADDPSSDAALLARFEKDRDAEAFELLVWRHGSLVLGVCLRMLRDEHAAEDAFQATFLILSRRAGSIRGSLASWLHSVARRVCLRFQKRRPELLMVDPPGRTEPDALQNGELQSVLDAEIARLPEKLRRVVILCYLEDRSAAEAALELGIPRGTVLSRLDAARRKLATSLTRRGFAPLALLALPLTTALPGSALVRALSRNAVEFVPGLPHTPITELATEVLTMSTRKWIAAASLALVLIAGATTGLGIVSSDGPGNAAVAQTPKVKPAEPAKAIDPKIQLDTLEKTDAELKKRIDQLNDGITAEQTKRDANVNPRVLQQAIDKIDAEVLVQDEKVVELREVLIAERKRIKPGKDYQPAEWQGLTFTANVPTSITQYPQFDKYAKQLSLYESELINARRSFKPDDPKVRELEGRTQKYRNEIEVKLAPELQRAMLNAQREEFHTIRLQAVALLEKQIEVCEAYPKKVAPRRAELVTRLNRALAISEEQKLLEDELQVLREFRKAVLKQKLTLKLESEGVVLPAEPKK